MVAPPTKQHRDARSRTWLSMSCSLCFTSSTVSVGSACTNTVIFLRLTRSTSVCRQYDKCGMIPMSEQGQIVVAQGLRALCASRLSLRMRQGQVRYMHARFSLMMPHLTILAAATSPAEDCPLSVPAAALLMDAVDRSGSEQASSSTAGSCHTLVICRIRCC